MEYNFVRKQIRSNSNKVQGYIYGVLKGVVESQKRGGVMMSSISGAFSKTPCSSSLSFITRPRLRPPTSSLFNLPPVRSISSAVSASLSTPETQSPHPNSHPLPSLGHATRPDFPILHQVLPRLFHFRFIIIIILLLCQANNISILCYSIIANNMFCNVPEP